MSAELYAFLSRRFLLSFLLMWLGFHAYTQAGCTDPQALNYQPDATENDGSCLYPPTNYLLQELAVLPPSIDESSGLAFSNGKLWTHNDSGDNAWLYRIDDETGALLQTVTVINAQNQDWEDLASDDTYVYIGDFGNNPGDRTNLRIFRIPIAGLDAGGPAAELIEFFYPDQTDFSVNLNNHNYDCEAFFFHNDSLHLFTKNWADLQTRHYTIPAQPGVHAAMLRDSMPVQGLITAADIDEQGHVVLLGYNTTTATSFLWLLFDYPGTEFFRGNKRRINLGSVFLNSQTEGLCFESGTLGGWVSAEKQNILPERLFRFSIEPWVTNMPSATQEVAPRSALVHVLQNPSEGTLHLEILQACSHVQLRLLNTNGSVLAYTSLPPGSPPGTFAWPIGVPNPGLCFLEVQCGALREVHRVVLSY